MSTSTIAAPKYNIKPKTTFETLSDLEKAIVTHYLITKHKIYKKEAEKIIHEKLNLEKFEEPVTAYNPQQINIFDIESFPFHGPEPGEEKFTFIDLFAGVGGFRMAMQANGGRCLFSSEWDSNSQKTYFANYGEVPFGDITKEQVKAFIPQKFDLLCGGFPCQPFSLAGVSKKNSLGRSHGFADEKQGNLFFHIADILERFRPKAFFLENVKNLVSHDKGNTFKVIKNTLLDLGYSFDSRVIDGKYFVPQHRERTLMVGFDKSVFGENICFDFDSIQLPEASHKAISILEPEVDPKYTLSDKLWNYLQEYAKKHKLKGNGFGFGLVNLESITRTMSARYHKDGAEILIPQAGGNPRRLTPKECAALQGYPIYPINTEDAKYSFRIPVSDTQAYRQFGNSVVMPLIRAVGVKINEKLTKKK
ncbi:MAG TPA: DNA (cytosine-5-)-methyltransferase [Sphingobacteriaceae bacterium]|nr:DNA (cytosine-5-)-methyltransferase [Sphingobacteriaceae bacterium]